MWDKACVGNVHTSQIGNKANVEYGWAVREIIDLMISELAGEDSFGYINAGEFFNFMVKIGVI